MLAGLAARRGAEMMQRHTAMKRTLFLVLGCCSLLAVAWLAWRTTIAAAPMSQASEPSVRVPAAQDAIHVDRELVPTADPDPAPAVSVMPAVAPVPLAPCSVDPWLARFQVVDEHDRPVPLATLTVLAAEHDRAVRASEPMLSLATDASGRVQTMWNERVVFVAAAKRDVGDSGEVRVARADGGGEAKLVLERALTLRGRVLGSDLLPAAGARVAVFDVSRYPPECVSPPDGVPTDAAGAFVFPVQRRVAYDLRAELDDAQSLTERVLVNSTTPEPVVLVFPGAIVLRGVVLDERGAPIARAGVQAWREADVGKTDASPRMQAAVYTGSQGRFEVHVQRFARYRLVAQADGHARSASVWAEPDSTCPRTESVLRLQAFLTIGGRVLDRDGVPLAGAFVESQPEGEGDRTPGGPSVWDLVGGGYTATTGDDGRFELQVSPGALETIVVWPGGYLDWRRVRRTGVVPGTRDLEIQCRSDEWTGCTVRAFVTRADGGPVDALLVDLRVAAVPIDLDAAVVTPQFVAHGFVLPPLPIGERYQLMVSLPYERDANGDRVAALAPAGAVFTTVGTELTLNLRLQPFAEVSIRVLDAAGRPARGLSAAVVTESASDRWMFPVLVDSDGRAFARYLVPGGAKVTVYDGWQQRFEQAVVLSPGLNPEVVVQLPVKEPPR